VSTDLEVPDGAAVRVPPPIVPVIALGLGLLLDKWPAPVPLSISCAVQFGVGGGLVAAGLGLMAAAIGLFRSTGQDPKPWESTPEIISTGIYGFTRNPMYLAMGFLQGGIGLMLVNVWVISLVPVTWFAIYRIAIRHEESYLEQKFGSVYQDYKKSVRRWL
jgi:protein-S-isoprenylcysteine O-methyltransferase Ste14